jgi:predicted phosphodiesterase
MPDGKPLPTAKLARLIYDENPLLFKSVESCRDRIRYVVGQKGDQLRSQNIKPEFFTDQKPFNPYSLPKSDETIYEPYFIKGKKILVLSDIHIPYHSISALTAAFDWGKNMNPDTILLNGDTIDSHQLSRFVRDPKKRHFGEELNAFKDMIQVIRDTFPKAQIIFKEGNHEERYNHFLYTKARELSGVEEFELQNIILSRARGVEYVAEKRVMKAGDLNIIHGHEFIGGTFSPVNIARGLFLKAKVSCIQGHNHQTSEHTETDMNGRITTTWSIGCLSELHPEYMRLNKWNHGFAFIEVDQDGSFQVHNKRIHKGEVL